jgi:endonuclease YncB( thermonuclease family)
MLTLRSAFILLALVLAAPASAVTVTGQARVVDGDTLVIGGEKLRLHGIDAPELDQPCARDGAAWRCGDWARAELAARVEGRALSCEGRGRDRYDRLLATCRIGETDLGQSLVRDGVAFAYRRYSSAYIPDEVAAMREGRGLWAGEVALPETFRHPPETLTGGCAIKGNISGSGQIYHRPGQRDYDAVRIDERKGERWFCTESEARAAGWRAARR